jgi:hypothetical protein
MEITGPLNVFLVGCLGGFANEVLHWWQLREDVNLPAYAKSPLYWVVTLVMIGLGGVVAWFQLGAKANAPIAMQLGLAAPLILQRLAASVPQAPGGKGAGDASIGNFLRS